MGDIPTVTIDAIDGEHQTNLPLNFSPDQQKAPEQLDPLLFISLIKHLRELIVKSTSIDESSECRLEISNLANQLKVAMAKADQRVQDFLAGDLSLKVQEELIEKLERQLELEKDLLKFMNSTLPNADSPISSPIVNPTSAPQNTEDDVKFNI
ncbi:hypothetical protein O181_100590 [Austropuccinia psidii MF-1]|uniref:Mediator of RNA polymerase II transcription subunit 9 n=1 Tax=Austropuccinia psidii MF-1 TaxID=1389203 RepID=A0A9Q3JFX7_9BASI|nr:hypothetical protein [Austropuccinia psidii MF-1]